MNPFSLKKVLKKKLLEEMIGEVKKSITPGEFMLLVVDRRTSKILSSCCRMFDVMETDVMLIENLSLRRQKLDFHAIYFIENTESSIKYLMKDYHPSPRKKPQYKSAHLFFTGRVSEEHMNMIQEREQLVKRIKTFKELNIDFLSYESQVFSFGRPCKTFSNIFLQESVQKTNEELKTASKQLVSLCTTLEIDPYIRYWNQSKAEFDESKAGTLSSTFANYFKKEFDDKKKQLTDWKRNEKRARGILLIVDRSIDPVSALMHEYTYQAMVNDLLKVDGELLILPEDKKKKENETEQKKPIAEERNSIELNSVDEGKSEKERKEEDKSKKEDNRNIQVLSEEDEIWNDLRHKHFSQVMEDIKSRTDQFRAQNKMAQYQAKDAEKSLKSMVEAAKGMAEYKEKMGKFGKHLKLSGLCLSLFESRFLQELGDLEQDMATGLTEDGKEVVVRTVKHNLVVKCQSDKIAVIDKMRLLMIYMISQGGIQKTTLQELMKTIDQSIEAALYNLPKLGVDIQPPPKDGNLKLSKSRSKDFKENSNKTDRILMRYIPYLQSLMTKLISWNLNNEEFPYIDKPPQGSQAPKKMAGQWRHNKKTKEDTKPIYIVFFLGGITFSEMRLIYNTKDGDKVNLLLGSTDILTPARFIRGLANLSQDNYVKGIHKSKGNADSDQKIVADENESDIEEEVPTFEDEKNIEPVPNQPPPEDDICSCLDRFICC